VFARRYVNRYLEAGGWKFWSCDVIACCAPENPRPCRAARTGYGCVINRALLDPPGLDRHLQIPGLEDSR
jgi:hypothetical protein